MALLIAVCKLKDPNATGDLGCGLAGGHFYRSNAQQGT